MSLFKVDATRQDAVIVPLWTPGHFSLCVSDGCRQTLPNNTAGVKRKREFIVFFVMLTVFLNTKQTLSTQCQDCVPLGDEATPKKAHFPWLPIHSAGTRLWTQALSQHPQVTIGCFVSAVMFPWLAIINSATIGGHVLLTCPVSFSSFWKSCSPDIVSAPHVQRM